jgi:multiple sugar transport system substrate-binding protein
MDGPRSRRDFLRLAAGAAATAVVGGAAGCGGSGSSKASEAAKAAKAAKNGGASTGRTLRIAQWGHYVPEFDTWFDGEYTKRWGDQHGVEVIVDHIPFAENATRAAAEVAAGGPHDIYGFIDPPSLNEDDVIDHADIVAEIESKVGKMTPLVARSVVNPKTGKVFGCPDYWVANPALYRTDLWNKVQPGLVPRTWDDLLRAGPKLKAMGAPLGFGLSPDGDSNYSLMSFLHSYGAALQDEGGNLTINRPATVEAVKMAAAIVKTGMTNEVFVWDAYSNNRLLASGKGSLILNAVSAIRAVEDQNPSLAAEIALAPMPTAGPGPGGPRAVYATAVNAIWKFSTNQDLARQFLLDLALHQRETFQRSLSYNLPAYDHAVPDLSVLLVTDDRAKPPDKYRVLADATSWCTNVGHPGHTSAAIMDVFNQFLVPKMFAAAAKGEMTAEEAVKAAEAQMKPIFDRWRERGKI